LLAVVQALGRIIIVRLLFVLVVSLKFGKLIIFIAIVLVFCISMRRQLLIWVKLIEVVFTALNSFLLRLRMYSRWVIMHCSILTTIVLFHWNNLIKVVSFGFVVWYLNTFWNSFIVFDAFKHFQVIFYNLLALYFSILFVFTLSQNFFFLIYWRFTRHLRNLIIFLSNVLILIVAMIIILSVFNYNRKIHSIYSSFNILSANNFSLTNKFWIIFLIQLTHFRVYLVRIN
jgi:hypothetical protein